MPIRSNVFQEEDVIIGANFDSGHHIVIRARVKIGNNVSMWSHCTVDPDAVIGNGVEIKNHVYIAQKTIIEDNVFIGPGTIFLNDKRPPNHDPSAWEPPIIRKGAIIGGGCVIGPGVEIGEGAIIGMGAVVVRDVPSRQVWAGNPARRLK